MKAGLRKTPGPASSGMIKVVELAAGVGLPVDAAIKLQKQRRPPVGQEALARLGEKKGR